MNTRARKILLVAAIVVSFVLLIFARVELYIGSLKEETTQQFVGSSVVAKGKIAEDPDVRATSVHVVLGVARINDKNASGKILVLVPRESTVSYGDNLVVRGLLVSPQTFETNTGRTFDYPGYLRVRGISAVMERAIIQSKTSGGLSPLSVLFSLKHRFESSLERVIPEPQVSLLEGILLGERGGFSQTLMQAFVVAGLIHIVVLSGSNISIVSEGIFRFLSWAPQVLQFLLGFCAIVLFALMAGGGAATLRAVIMGAIAILARYLRRPADALRALAVAAGLMVLWNPPIVLYDNGFILSVLATFGMITLSPWFEGLLKALPAKRFNFRSIVATTLGVEVFILPALLYFSGVLSFVSVPFNALVLPVIPVIMFLGCISGLLGLVHPLIASIPAIATDVLLRAIVWLVQTAATIPLGSYVIPPFSGWIVAVLYVPLTWFAISVYRRSVSLSHSS